MTEAIWVEHPTKSGTIGRFDISKEACEPFGFIYGDRLRTPKGEATVIGVAQESSERYLWLLIDNDSGASYWNNCKCRDDFIKNGFTCITTSLVTEVQVADVPVADALGIYKLKKVDYKDASVNIILQNENGPCPLIALCNVLSLKKILTIEGDCGKNEVSVESLRDLVATLLLSQSKPESQAQVDKSVKALTPMQTGMDVNFNFCKHDEFDMTDQTAVFAMLTVPLVHGWLVSNDNSQTSKVVGKNTYNELMNKLVAVDEYLTAKSNPPPSAPLSSSADNSNNSNSNSNNAEATKPLTEQDILDGKVIRSFLDSNQSQLTECGLIVLQQCLKEDDLCVFFRNNHFSTLTKHDGKLYNLVTDVGYERERNIVWDCLLATDGGSILCSADFQPLDKKIQEEVISTLELMDFTRQQIDAVLPKIPAEKWFKPEDAISAAIAHLTINNQPSYVR